MSGVEVASKLRRFQVDRLLNEVNGLCALRGWGFGFCLLLWTLFYV